MVNNISSFHHSVSSLPSLQPGDLPSVASPKVSKSTASNDDAGTRPVKPEGESYQVKLSPRGQTRAAFGAFQSAMDELSDPKTATPFDAASSAAAMGAATVAMNGASAGSYEISLPQSARAQAPVIPAYSGADQTVAGTGRSPVETGRDDANKPFAPSAAGAKTIVAAPASHANSSLRSSAAAATSKAEAGVAATVERLPRGGHLPEPTGAKPNLHIAVSENGRGSTNVSVLPTLPPTAAATASAKQLAEPVAAQDAVSTANGNSHATPSNAVATAARDMALPSADTGTAGATGARHVTAFQDAARKFVAAYNNLLGQAGDSKQKTAAVVDSGDNRVPTALAEMHHTLDQASGGTGGGLTLDGIGITREADGKLGIDNSGLEYAVRRNAGGAASLLAKVAKRLSSIAGEIAGSAPKETPRHAAFAPQALGMGAVMRQAAPQSLFDLTPPQGLFTPAGSYSGTSLYSLVSSL